MFNSVRVQRRVKREPGIDMAPLIDMVFILLIFFLVTTTFIRETGIQVKKPEATTAESLGKESMMIGISSEGEIWFEQRRIDLLTLCSSVEKRLRERPGSPIVIVPDKGSQTGVLIDVMDECRLAGADRISVASKKEL
ncbi:MAG: biopolymer transporter ExbD [Planctomycetota bacterium]